MLHCTVPPAIPLVNVADVPAGADTETTVSGEGSVTVMCPSWIPATPTFKARTWTPKFVPDLAVSGASTVTWTSDWLAAVTSLLSPHAAADRIAAANTAPITTQRARDSPFFSMPNA